MITYTATNTKTGQLYIGSAKNYCHFMNRKGNHHIGKPYNQFRKDLQTDPLAFEWDYSEDELETRDFEESLLALHVGSKWCYNECTNPYGFDSAVAKRANAAIKDRSRSEETRRKIGEGNRNPSSEKREALSQSLKTTNSKKTPCPQCGMLMNVGNLTKHLKGTRCKGTL
jgi:hypothetical protein